MIEIFFPASIPYRVDGFEGDIRWYTETERDDYLGIGQQFFAQMMGWC